MFNLREFIMQGLRDAVGKMADYQVILNAAGWQEKGVLTVDDLAELQECINMKNTPAPEPEVPEPPIEDPLPEPMPEVPQEPPIEPTQEENIETEQA